MIREAINEGENDFKEILPLIEKSSRFKHWLQQKELLSNVVYGALGSVPHFLNTIDEFYSTDYLS